MKELEETMIFLSERINDSDFTLAKATSTDSDCRCDVSQINATFTYPKNKQSITIQLNELVNEGEKASFLSKILLRVYQRNEQLLADVKTQQLRMKELLTRSERAQTDSSSVNRIFDGSKLLDPNDSKANVTKLQDRAKMSLINPTKKRRKAVTGVNYDDDNSD